MTKIIHWLLPKEEKFFLMLKGQSSIALRGALELKKLVDYFNKLSSSKRKEYLKTIKDLEHKGDELSHKIIEILDKTFITPIDKEDIHHLVMLLDDVIDYIKTTAERIIIFKIDRTDSYMKKLSEIVVDIVGTVDRGILRLDKLKNMNQFYIKVHSLENKGDEIYHAALAKLFERKDVIAIIKNKEIIEFLENIIDKCETIAKVIESIVVKHA